MAAPESMNTFNISGTFVLNKGLSDTGAMDKILTQQGVGWITRTAISRSTITVKINHYKDDSGVEHIDIDQSLSVGGGSTEKRTLDWQERENQDRIFGAVVGQSRRTAYGDVADEWLKADWTEDTKEHGLIDALARSDTPKSKTTWEAHMTWGFQVVDDARRYTRHIRFTGPSGEVTQARMTYDYQGA